MEIAYHAMGTTVNMLQMGLVVFAYIGLTYIGLSIADRIIPKKTSV